MITEKSYNKLTEGVSVVIVTYNGKDRLFPTLKHLAQQQNIFFDFEIILVDNNSYDGTVYLVDEYWKKLGAPFDLRIVIEKNPGTMFARKKGIEETKYRYLLYCDDDNWFCTDYVYRAYDIISKNQEIAAVGGKGFIQYDDDFIPPTWIEKYEKNYGTGQQGKKDGDTSRDKGCLYTAGAIFDVKWLYKLYKSGFESSLKGRDGKSLVAGEDTELTYALRIIGGKLYYSSKMTFKHYMPATRINWLYLKKLWYSFGVADYIILPYNNYLSKKKNAIRLKLIINSLLFLTKLKIKIFFKGLKEGDRDILIYEMKKGFLFAILRKHIEHIKASKIVDKLKA